VIIFRIGITIDVHAVIRENRDFQLIAHDSDAGPLLCIAPGVLYKIFTVVRDMFSTYAVSGSSYGDGRTMQAGSYMSDNYGLFF
jgi:hypothetical protein